MKPAESEGRLHPILLLYKRLTFPERYQVRRWMESMVAQKIHKQRSPSIADRMCMVFVQQKNRELTTQEVYHHLDGSVSTKSITHTVSRRDDLFKNVSYGVYCLHHSVFRKLCQEQQDTPWGAFDA